MNPLLPVEYLALLSALVVAAGVYLGWKSAAKASRRVRAAVVAARCCGMLVLAAIAFNPGDWRRDAWESELELAVTIDRSMSMGVADAGGKTRIEEAGRLARKAAALAVEHGIKARLFSFSDMPEATTAEALSGLKADGSTTDIPRAGKALLALYRGGGPRLAGVLLLSDGRQVRASRTGDFTLAARAHETPVFAVALGGAARAKNLVVTPARGRRAVFAGQKTKIAAVVSNRGCGPVSIAARLFDSQGAEAAVETITMSGDGEAEVDFEIAAGARGFYEYRIEIPRLEGESSETDNTARVGVWVLGGRMKILLVEGVPFWDSKFAAQLLRKQPNMELTSIYRVSGERFFRVETDLSRVSDSPQSVFPDSAGEIALYDAIIFGKGVEYFLDEERIRLLRFFVRDRGGCVVFARGKPYSGTFPALEHLEAGAWGQRIEEQFLFAPTAAGEDAGLFGDLLPAAADPVWLKLPQLRHAYRCPDMKQFTSVLAEGVYESGGERRAAPLVVSRRFGRGTIVTVNSEGLWQWDFFPAAPEAGAIYRELWPQLIQWAALCAEYLPGQAYSIRLSSSVVGPDEPVRVAIGYRGDNPPAEPPVVRLVRDGRVAQEVAAARSPAGENRWDAILTGVEPGEHRVELAEADRMSEEGGGPMAALFVRAPAGEMDELSSDPAFLERLAADAGGRLVNERDFGPVIAGLRAADSAGGAGETVWAPMWDRWWALAVVAAFFGLEWFLRRRNGLM